MAAAPIVTATDGGSGGGGGGNPLQAALVHVVLPLVLGLGLLVFVVNNGKHLVNKPQLCPQLAVTVLPAPKVKGGSKKTN